MAPLLLVVLLCPFLAYILRFLHLFLFAPALLSLRLRRCGLSGPPRRFSLFGNAGELRGLVVSAQAAPLPSFHHDVAARVVPHLAHWAARYGPPFVYWLGPTPIVVVTDPALVRAALEDSAAVFEKVGLAAGSPFARELVGDGLIGLKGPKWARHRQIIAPAFSAEHMDHWIPEIADSVSSMIGKWESQGGERLEFEIDVYSDFHILIADIISRVVCGSSYEEGKEIFQLHEELTRLVIYAMRRVYITGLRFFPTNKNRRRWYLNQEIRRLFRKLIWTNENKSEDPRNLLQLMILASKATADGKMGIEEIIDECKTVYFFGKETSANLLCWVVLLLALHQDWQQKARQEVIEVCGKSKPPDAAALANLKTVSMVLKETLRLYPVAAVINRKATKDAKLGTLDIPAGTLVQIPTISIHHDPNIWGENSNEFDPSRFQEGTIPHRDAYFPFGIGPAMCVSDTFATVQVKVALSMILQWFAFEVSPSYIHAPTMLITVQPQFGAQVLIRRL